MLVVKEYIDQLINKYCQNDSSPMEKVYALYTWITKNIKYNYEGQKYEQAYVRLEGKDLHDQSHNSNKMRSSFVALFDKTSICVGISYLFNVMLADLGILTECNFVRQFNRHEAANMNLVLPNHQISSIQINGDKYYFDPTSDLARAPNDLKFFGLNKFEASTRYNQLSIFEKNVENGPSIYAKLKTYANYDEGALKLMETISERKMLDEFKPEKAI